jgi:predicted metalloenzyme YecM
MLAKKVDTLTKAMESEAKKSRREIAAMEKELAATRLEKEQDSRAKRFGGGTSGSANSSQLPPGRYFFVIYLPEPVKGVRGWHIPSFSG